MSKQNKIVIDINAAVNGQQQVGQLSVNLGELQKASERASDSMAAMKWAAVAQGAEAVASSINALQKTFENLSNAYAVQEQVESQLATVMRERMDATDDEIDSIKRLCSAQQELGVIGDEVQLAGAQQIATFISEREALEVLIPAMNNLAAQQKGLNVTSQDCMAVASLFGKAMNGNTKVFKGLGIQLTDAQKEIIETGTEMQKAALIAELVKAKTGDMNAELAKTSSGKMKQLSNTLGDVKEQLGAMASQALPFVTIIAQTTTATAGVIKFSAGLKSAIVAMKGFDYAGKASAAAAWLLGVKSGQATKALRVMTSDLLTGRNAALALRMAFSALMKSVAILWLINIALQGLMKFFGLTEKAADSMGAAFEDQAQRALELKQSLRDASEEQAQFAVKQNEYYTAEIKDIEKLYKKATDETKSREERIKAIKKMQQMYPQYFSKLQAEKLDVDALSQSYEELRKNIILVARAKAAEDLLVENQREQITLNQKWDRYGKGGEGYRLEQRVGSKVDEDVSRVRYLYGVMGQSSVGESFLATAGLSKRGKTLYTPDPNDTYEALTGNKSEIRKAEMAAHMAGYDKYHYADYIRRQQAYGLYGGIGFKQSVRDGVLEQATASLGEHTADYNQIVKEREADLKSLTNLKEQEEAYEKIIAEGETAKDITKHGTGSSGSTGKADPVLRENATILSEIEENIQFYQKELQSADKDSAGYINQQIEKWEALANEIKNAGKTTEDLTRIAEPKNLKEIAHNLKVIEKLKLTATEDELKKLNQEAESLQKKQEELQNLGLTKEDNSPKLDEKATTLAGIEENIQYYQAELQKAGVAEAAIINASIDLWQKKADSIRNAGKAQERTFAQLRKGYSAFRGLNDSITSVVKTLQEEGSEWEKTLAVVDAGLKVYDGVNDVIKIVRTLTKAKKAETAATTAGTIAKTADAAAGGTAAAASAGQAVAAEANTTAVEAEATANIVDAAAKTFNAHSWLPWVGVGLAAGMVGLMIAKMGGLPKFAKGGIAYGPTVGLFGEYSGASNNPEVVAPLDRLRDLIEPTGGSIPEKITLTAKGTDLEAVINTRNRRLSR